MILRAWRHISGRAGYRTGQHFAEVFCLLCEHTAPFCNRANARSNQSKMSIEDEPKRCSTKRCLAESPNVSLSIANYPSNSGKTLAVHTSTHVSSAIRGGGWKVQPKREASSAARPTSVRSDRFTVNGPYHASGEGGQGVVPKSWPRTRLDSDAALRAFRWVPWTNTSNQKLFQSSRDSNMIISPACPFRTRDPDYERQMCARSRS
jgi:hypothetical protein